MVQLHSEVVLFGKIMSKIESGKYAKYFHYLQLLEDDNNSSGSKWTADISISMSYTQFNIEKFHIKHDITFCNTNICFYLSFCCFSLY